MFLTLENVKVKYLRNKIELLYSTAYLTSLKDIKKNNVGNKLVTAAQLGTIGFFSEDAVGQILEVLDNRSTCIEERSMEDIY